MATTISSLASTVSLYSGLSALENRAGTANTASKALSSAVESARVQLSNIGQARSATASAESAAEALRDKARSGSTDGLSKAVQGFANAVNEQISAAGKAGDSRVARLDVTRGTTAQASGNVSSVSDPSSTTRQALNRIGISVASNGSLSVDTQRLQSAITSDPQQVRQTLDKIATSTVNQSERQLAAGSGLSRAEAQATTRSDALQQAQDQSESRLTQLRQAVQKLDTQANTSDMLAQQAFNFSGAAAYLRTFSI